MRIWWVMVLLVACGDDAAVKVDAPAAIDASVDGAIDAAIDAPPCTTAMVEGGYIEETRVAEDLPTPMGGEIVDGTYLLASQTLYTGAAGATGPTGVLVRAKSINTGGVFQYVDDPNVGQALVTTGTYAIDGIDIAITFTCPFSFVSPLNKVTADPNGFTLFDAANQTGPQAIHYVKVQ